MLAAIAAARAIVIGPSNPVISIGPILAVPGIREALLGGDALRSWRQPGRRRGGAQGPHRRRSWHSPRSTCSAERRARTSTAELLDGIVADEPLSELPTLQLDTLMSDAASRARVAERTLAFAQSLAG